MYNEWESPGVDVSDGVSFRAWVQNMHNNITAPGTGLTQLTLDGQFDFDNETIMPDPSHSNMMLGTSLSKPLYYKYESVGNKTLYIKFYFAYNQYTSYMFKPKLFTMTGVWESEADMISEKQFFSPPSTVIPPLKWNVSTYQYQDNQHTPSTGKSYIVNNKGTLMIAVHTAFIDNVGTHRHSQPLLFLCVESNPKGFNQLRHNNYDNSIDYNVRDSGSSDIVHQFYYTAILTVRDGYANYVYSHNTMLLSESSPAFMQFVSSTHDSELYSFKRLLYYNKQLIGGQGFATVDGKVLFLCGYSMDQYNFGNRYMTFAVVAEG